MEINHIYLGDAIDVLKTFPDNFIDCCVTSPPYYGLRSYLPEDHPDKSKEVGLQGSPEEYVRSLVEIFREVKRVIKPEGTVWLNLGDSYANKKYNNIKRKDQFLIPHRVAIALCDDGWYIRSDICYHKKNSMPSSIKDRPVSSKEYVFLLTKSPKYYYDWEAVATDPAPSYAHDKRAPGILRNKFYEGSKYTQDDCDPKIAGQFKKQEGVNRSDYIGFNARYKAVEKVRRRDVWSLTVQGSKIKHFAMMNPKLIELCIKAGCPEGGIVLDPFIGSGNVALISKQLGCNYIGIDLNPDYVELARSRLNTEGD